MRWVTVKLDKEKKIAIDSAYSSPPSLSSSSLNSASCSSRLCLPTPRPRWPLLLPLQSPVDLPSFRRLLSRDRIAWLHRSSANSSVILVWFLPGLGPEASWSPPGRFPRGSYAGFSITKSMTRVCTMGATGVSMKHDSIC